MRKVGRDNRKISTTSWVGGGCIQKGQRSESMSTYLLQGLTEKLTLSEGQEALNKQHVLRIASNQVHLALVWTEIKWWVMCVEGLERSQMKRTEGRAEPVWIAILPKHMSGCLLFASHTYAYLHMHLLDKTSSSWAITPLIIVAQKLKIQTTTLGNPYKTNHQFWNSFS